MSKKMNDFEATKLMTHFATETQSHRARTARKKTLNGHLSLMTISVPRCLGGDFVGISAKMSLLVVLLLVVFSSSSAWGADFQLPDLGNDYEVFSLPGKEVLTRSKEPKTLLRETPRNAINEDGLMGFFVAETADRLKGQRMFSSARYAYADLTSRSGKAYFGSDGGHVNTLILSAVYIGDWAEWSVSVPMHDYTFSAPRTYGTISTADSGLGDLKLGWKATYLPDRSYYRFAYGAVVTAATGDDLKMAPAGVRGQDELKLFGCVTTRETDNAVGNFELGTIINAEGDHNRFIYRGGFSYEANQHASLIGELAGEIEGGNDHDTLDLIAGIRLSPTPTSVLELAYTKNLRTYREYGWDEKIQAGVTIRW